MVRKEETEMERDPYDLFLERCLRETANTGVPGKGGMRAREISENICPRCLERVVPGSRFCPSCGAFQEIPKEVAATFRPRTIIRNRLAVTLIAIERGCEICGRLVTKVYLKVQNMSPMRVHVSLTYIESVLIDVTGRQFSPIDPEELPECFDEPVFPAWFYIYADAYKDGVLLFDESPVPLQKAIICAMHQENQDELFIFELDTPPKA